MFFRIFSIATLAFVIISVLPLWFVSTLLAWAIVVTAGWRYPLAIVDRVRQMSNPTGYAVGMGALMGAAVNFIGVVIMVVYSTAVVGMLALHAPHYIPGHESRASEAASAIGMLNVFGTMSWGLQAIGAPFWGAILGAFGGLIGGSQVPKATPATQGET